MNLIRALIWAGTRACLAPLIFDVAVSIEAGRPDLYAPFLYPMFFLLGLAFEFEKYRKERNRPPVL